MTSPPETKLLPVPQPPPLNVVRYAAPVVAPRIWPIFTAFAVLLPTLIVVTGVIEIAAMLFLCLWYLQRQRNMYRKSNQLS